MIAHVYGRHPSIDCATLFPECKISFGVNGAPVDCDWTVYGDALYLDLMLSGKRPRRHRVGLIGPACYELDERVKGQGEYRTWRSMGRPFVIRKSGVMALLAAFRFGATEIHTYGMRREGDVHAGYGPPEVVKPLRWVYETRSHLRMCDFLAKNGARVIEH